MSIFPFRIFRSQGKWAFVYDIRDGEGEKLRVLRVGGAFQSATYYGDRRWDLPFEYMRAFDRMFDADGVRDVLMIGGGGCSWPKHALHDYEDVAVDVLERSRSISDIARELFYVDELEREHKYNGRFKLIVGDAADYLSGCPKMYDAIVNDAFNGADFDESMIASNALGLSKSRLRKDGLYLANVVSEASPEGADRLCAVLDRLKTNFAHVYIVPATDEALSDYDNYIVIATDGLHSFKDAIEFE